MTTPRAAQRPEHHRSVARRRSAAGRAAGRALAAGLGLLAAMAGAQTPLPVLRPLTAETIAPALARPVGEPVRAARAAGDLDLKGRRVHIAEYLLLWDVSGQVPVASDNGQVLGFPVSHHTALLNYRSQPDIAALQALTDRAWADLQARLAAAGVVLADAAATVRAHGAVHAATQAGSTPAAPVWLEARTGQATRRYLMLAPTGMALVPRGASGLGLGQVAARVGYPLAGVEALSVVLAVHLGAPDPVTPRPSAFESPGGQPAWSPVMELVPAPAAALVHAHAQGGLLNLAEALVPAAPFGRLRRAAMDGPIAANDPLASLRSLGRQWLGESALPQVDAVLDLDGPSTARLVLAITSAAHQAIADGLRAAR